MFTNAQVWAVALLMAASAFYVVIWLLDGINAIGHREHRKARTFTPKVGRVDVHRLQAHEGTRLWEHGTIGDRVFAKHGEPHKG